MQWNFENCKYKLISYIKHHTALLLYITKKQTKIWWVDFAHYSYLLIKKLKKFNYNYINKNSDEETFCLSMYLKSDP